MSDRAKHDAWSAGQHYEQYMGRWSRQIAIRFIDWLQPAQDADWLDVGCGTGALSQTILDLTTPKSLIGIDPSEGFVDHCRRMIADPRAGFEVAGAEKIPLKTGSVDVAASALVLNFVPDRKKAFAEMHRVVRQGGVMSFYVWDYPGGGMGFIDAFWKAACELDPSAGELDEGQRFPFCTQEGLRQLCRSAGYDRVETVLLETVTTFPTFEDFWQPFTLGAGPAPGYNQSLGEQARSRLKAKLKSNLDTGGEVSLPARAWAVKIRV